MVWYLGGRGLLMRSFYRMAASPDLCNKAEYLSPSKSEMINVVIAQFANVSSVEI